MRLETWSHEWEHYLRCIQTLSKRSGSHDVNYDFGFERYHLQALSASGVGRGRGNVESPVVLVEELIRNHEVLLDQGIFVGGGMGSITAYASMQA